MELQKLKYFQTVAHLEHVTRAADQLHISQPSLTQAIHALEQELNVPLFCKIGRRIELTEYGRHLKERVDDLLPALERIPQELEQLRTKVNKTVRLNILAASSLVISIIVSYRRLHPDVIFAFEQNSQKNDCDIVITTNGVNAGSAQTPAERYVKEEPIYLAVPRHSRYAAYPSIDLAEVREEGFVMLSSSRPFGVICKRFCSIAGFEPRILFESDSPIAVQNIIGTGSGVAFWPAYSWGAVEDENVALIPIISPDCRRDLILERYERLPDSEYVKDFYCFLKQQL